MNDTMCNLYTDDMLCRAFIMCLETFIKINERIFGLTLDKVQWKKSYITIHAVNYGPMKLNSTLFY